MEIKTDHYIAALKEQRDEALERLAVSVSIQAGLRQQNEQLAAELHEALSRIEKKE